MQQLLEGRGGVIWFVVDKRKRQKESRLRFSFCVDWKVRIMASLTQGRNSGQSQSKSYVSEPEILHF